MAAESDPVAGNHKLSLDPELAAQLLKAFADSALPGEDFGFDADVSAEAAEFALLTGMDRTPGKVAMAIESTARANGLRYMRIAIFNDDMPFLVDSVCATIAGLGIAIERLIHPVIRTVREPGGRLVRIAAGVDEGAAESVIYLEIERVDAKLRRRIERQLLANLTDVAAAVADWRKMQAALGDDLQNLSPPPPTEGASLIRWFLDGNLTMLGHETLDLTGERSELLGIARNRSQGFLSLSSQMRAQKWFRDGGQAPLVIKSNHLSTIHRRVLMDLIVMPVRRDGELTGLAITAGLWTSAALAAPPEKVPLLRSHLAGLFDSFAFDPAGHAGKSMIHALTTLPHDILVSSSGDGLQKLVLIAMSVIDRPRPKLHFLTSPLKRHLFVFVWLPRDEVSTQRREAIETMLVSATNGTILNFSNALEEGGTSLLRYTLDMGPDGIIPDAEALDHELGIMVRGWLPAVEARLAEVGEPGRAAVLARRYAEGFPLSYRSAYGAAEAAGDILRLFDLERGGKSLTRLFHLSSDDPGRLRLKIYHIAGGMALSDAVPTLENFGFRVIQEIPTPLDSEDRRFIHDFLLGVDAAAVDPIAARAGVLENAITAVLEGKAENDAFNRLITEAGLDAAATIWFRSWFRYLRQTGLSYGLATVVDALAEGSEVTVALIDLFRATHDPEFGEDRNAGMAEAEARIADGLTRINGIDDDRILRLFGAVIRAILRTNAFAPQAAEALAFKIDSAKVPDLPNPVPWREVFVYSPRVEGIHLRAGPVARGGLRWSDRRDDFRTEILGLMKAQRVKNAVIVPTGAKGGFYPKFLPPADDRTAWLAEGTEAYRIFIRSLLSVTDNIVDGKVVHPDKVVVHDGEDPYFVVAADKGTATFSDTANAIAVERQFWLGDAFASGGSNGYDHKAMGITAKGAWISVQRHFAEAGVDVQSDPVTVVGVGDMSGDVFGNGMLLSKAIRLIAAFDHRHIFLDPDPDPARSWAERKRLFDLPRSSWADYDPALISKGGAVYSRHEKQLTLTPEIMALLHLTDTVVSPTQLMRAILTAQADLMWFGGIGTYVKAGAEGHIDVGDPANDAIRVNAEALKVSVIGEGANLGITQAARIAFAGRGGRINTDFIDNSAGVDCSDNEVNIKIAFNRELLGGSLTLERRNTVLESMTDAVAELVLDDNRLQALGLSIAEMGGIKAMPSYIRLIDMFEEEKKLDRLVEGIAAREELLRRSKAEQPLLRPELAVLLSTAKLAVQDAVERDGLGLLPDLDGELLRAFPEEMAEDFAPAILGHQLRGEIVATKIANRMINRLGIIHPFELAEEEGCTLGEIARAFVIVEKALQAQTLWDRLAAAQLPETARLLLYDRVAFILRTQMADVMRTGLHLGSITKALEILSPRIMELQDGVDDLLTAEGKLQAAKEAAHLVEQGATPDIAKAVVALYKIDGAAGIAHLAHQTGQSPIAVALAFTALGSRLGLDWAQMTALRINPSDPWDRLLVSGLARDFHQMRFDLLRRGDTGDLRAFIDHWCEAHMTNIARFRSIIARAQQDPRPSISMLAQIAGQARLLLSR